MPNTMPSVVGGSSVSEVLHRIPVQDRRHHRASGQARRQEDFEVSRETPWIWGLVLLAVGALFFIRIPTRIPEPLPDTATSFPMSTRWPETPAPANLRANVMGPRMVELTWDSMGEGYRYMLFYATDGATGRLMPLLEQSTPASHAVWVADAQTERAWITVQGIDPLGNQTTLSRSIPVGFPPQ